MNRYKAELVKFMSFKDDSTYATDHTFTMESLLEITPGHICHWMNKRAYGEPEPSDDAKPVSARSSTLEFAKKAISSFMPRVNATWDPVSEQGNPTRSDAVNKLIKKVKRFEVRREGADSNARRAIEFDEFVNLLELVRMDQERNGIKYMIGSVLTLQWHIVARIDDMMKLKFDNFSANTQFPLTLLIQVRWSKNISEERDAPVQILFGSLDPRILDPRMCALLNLAVYIETTATSMESEFVYGNPNDGDRVVRRVLQDTFENPGFKKLKSGKLGTHSLRKGAATYCTRCGFTKDNVNRRGRWRMRKDVVDAYIDTTQPYPDACTAAALSGPLGPCFYRVREGINSIDTRLLVDEIAPNVKRHMGEAIAKTLALPLLWAALQQSDDDFVLLPDRLKQRVIQAYKTTGGNVELNPVDRETFYVVGDGSHLNLVAIADEKGTTNRPNSCASGGAGEGSRREFAALHSQLLASQHRTTQIMNEVVRNRQESHRELQKIQAILRRLAASPLPRQASREHHAQHSSETAVEQRRSSTPRLSKRPKDLFELWHEYQFGLAGLKAAKEFSRSERGANKFAYSRRKPFWDVIASLVRSGYTSDTAIDKVYAVYGRNLSVSSILKSLREDRKRGGHPSLRVQ
ncbi:hypothetical protein PHMEG_00025112 [Phytophthora megakarya]|uniref:Uncharacterized protein n=1 Tax=Phytophthora megakarya TaxID=4795 RepID=A0A225VBX5_9STRA|nr:hypothetical protein PHMEG_00025112 [Phytophthora megakarya]